VERASGMTTLWNGRAFWAEYIAPEPKPEPHPGPPTVFLPGQAVSFCADCSNHLRPGERCSTVSAQARREMTPTELFAAPLCPLDLEDELYRRRFGATRAELEDGERIEREVTEKDDGRGPWLYFPDRLRLRRNRK
jgi:hypothetical protein